MISFYWHVTPNGSIQLLGQQIVGTNWITPHRISIPLSPTTIDWDKAQQMRRMRLPLVDEPSIYYCVSADMGLAEEYYMPNECGGCTFPYIGSYDQLPPKVT